MAVLALESSIPFQKVIWKPSQEQKGACRRCRCIAPFKLRTTSRLGWGRSVRLVGRQRLLLEHERSFLSHIMRVRLPNLSRWRGYATSLEVLVMQYCPGGSLHQLIRRIGVSSHSGAIYDLKCTLLNRGRGEEDYDHVKYGELFAFYVISKSF